MTDGGSAGARRVVRVARNLLPESAVERREVLRRYFCQLTATSVAAARCWEITLEWTSDPGEYIDPRIDDGVRWWSRAIGPIDVATIPLAHYDGLGFFLSLDDSWTGYTWSRWLHSLGPERLPPKVTVLHVDDHTDLMSPRLLVSSEGWRDGISGSAVSVFDPPSIAAAIATGAIGIGSFMAPMFHTLPFVEVRHLCATTRHTLIDRRPMHLVPTAKLDALLAPETVRLALRPELITTDRNRHRYLVTNDLSTWLSDLEDGPVLLHLDMDQFNNRYDGNPVWQTVDDRHDPPLVDVLDSIDSMFMALRSRQVLSRIVDVAVALSPGFFPAEYWPAAVDRIAYHLGRQTRHPTISAR